MKVLLNKLGKANKVFLSIYLVTLVVYIVTYIFLVINLVNLSGIETFLRILLIAIFGIWLIAYLLWNLINLILKKHVIVGITTAVTVIFIGVFCFANYYMNVLYEGISNLGEREYVTYTANLVAKNGVTIDKNSKLGMINSSDDIEGNVLAKELIKEEGLEDCEVISYSSYYEMIFDLLNDEVDGVFLSSNYKTIFGEEEGFEELKNTTIVYTYSKKMENRDSDIVSNKSLTEPFTILLMGVDSTADGLDANTAFNGDTLMLITFNPNTLNATVFSIPRDTYVPIACNNNRYAKINSSAAYGTSCVIDTVEQMTSIEVDYYVKVNFKAVVDLVEALGGIDVDVEVPDYSVYYEAHNGRICEQNSLRQKGEHLVCMDTGMQHLNGEQALAYARCRHAFLQSDIARNRHQQQIIEAIAKEIVKSENINRVEEILNAITNNLATNMSQKQILSFYEVMKDMVTKSFDDGEFITIQKTYLEYYSLPVKLSNNGIFTSAIGYYPDSLAAIVDLMKVNLELKEKEIIKTFSFDANEEYETAIVGKGIKTGDKLETVPDFTGKTVEEAEAWATEQELDFKIEYSDVGDKHYNAGIEAGLVANQNYSRGILVNNVSEFIVYVNNAASDAEEPAEEEELDNNLNTETNNNTNNTNNGNTGSGTTGGNNNTGNTETKPPVDSGTQNPGNSTDATEEQVPTDNDIQDDGLSDILPSEGENTENNTGDSSTTSGTESDTTTGSESNTPVEN